MLKNNLMIPTNRENRRKLHQISKKLKILICSTIVGLFLIFSNPLFNLSKGKQIEKLPEQKQVVQDYRKENLGKRDPEVVKKTPVEVQKVFDENTDYYDAKVEYEATQAKLDINIKSIDNFITFVNNKMRFITYSISGSNHIHHEMNKDKSLIKKWLASSESDIYFDYTALFGLSSDDIKMESDGTKVSITIDYDKLGLLGIDSDNPIIKSNKSIFGHKCTNDESLKLVDSAKEMLAFDLERKPEVKEESIKTLNDYLINMANSFGVTNLDINGKSVLCSYTYSEPEQIKYNRPNQKVSEVQYIVVHSTAVKEMTAWDWYFRWSKPTERGVSAHYVCDNKDVIRCINPDQYASYNCGNKEDNLINNYNTVSIEMSEFNDSEKQWQTIVNCANFVKMLKHKYPNAIVISHRGGTNNRTKCPHILSDEQFNRIFEVINNQ